jgi:hypothetical protein
MIFVWIALGLIVGVPAGIALAILFVNWAVACAIGGKLW